MAYEDDLRARLDRGIATPSAGQVDGAISRARARAFGPRGPRPGTVLAAGVAIAVLILAFSSVIASLKPFPGPASRAPLPAPSQAVSVESPSPSPQPTPSPTDVPSPVSPAPNSGPLVVLPTTAQVLPAGPSAVWVSIAGTVGDLLFRSQDKGTNWEQRSLPNPYQHSGSSGTQLTFVDATHGWAVSTGSPETQCAHQGLTVLRTIDGASTWQNIGASGVGSTQCKGNISFADQQTGFISAWDSNNPPVIYRTVTGGTSWAPSAPLPNPPGQQASGALAGFVPGQVARFGTDLVVEVRGPGHVHVYRSRDGGANWIYVTTIPGTTDADVSFLDASHWWLSGPGFGPNYRYTADGGNSYTAAPGAPNSAAPISPVFTFAGLSLGYATVRGSIWTTTDGGGHWSTLHTPGT